MHCCAQLWQHSHFILEGGSGRAAYKWILLSLYYFLHIQHLYPSRNVFGKSLSKTFWCIHSKRAPTCESELPLEGPGQGGETLSEVLFLPDLWAAPGISSVFSPAGWKGVSRKRTREESVSVWENCRAQGV